VNLIKILGTKIKSHDGVVNLKNQAAR